MKALITGITGFVGPHLAEHIIAEHPTVEVSGMAYGHEGREHLRPPLVPPLRILEGDLTDGDSLRRVVRSSRPDIVFHLAAASSVGTSWKDPATAYQINVIGQSHLFEALRAEGLKPLVVVPTSGEIYGRACDGGVAATEACPLQPQSPYGVSKAAQDLMACQYDDAGLLPTVRLRLFNHTGPRRQSSFVASSFARRIAEIERGELPPALDVGNIDVVRDFTDVRDIVRAYWLAAQRGTPGEAYNVCSGRDVAIREILDRLLALSEQPIRVRRDESRLRAADIPVLFGSHRKFTDATGWTPEIDLDTTLSDLLDWWRSRQGASA